MTPPLAAKQVPCCAAMTTLASLVSVMCSQLTAAAASVPRLVLVTDFSGVFLSQYVLTSSPLPNVGWPVLSPYCSTVVDQ